MTLAADAEVDRLAVLLGVARDELAFLARFDAVELRALRCAVVSRAQPGVDTTARRLARASRLTTPRVLARVAERSLPPVVSAAVVAELPADHAAAVAGELSAEYLADVTRYLSPSVAEPVVALLTDDVLIRTAGVLLDRQDFVTMAENVCAFTPEQTLAVARALDDAATLVEIALRIGDADTLTELVHALPDDVLTGMVRAASRRARLWPELLGLLGRVPAGRRVRLLGTAVRR